MHILIIEDEEETRREMTDFLENSLHRVTAFTEFEHIINETGDFTGELRVEGPEGTLVPGGIYTEPFSQDGHNGADYLLIVSDKTAGKMTPFYRLLMVNLTERAPENLQQELDKVSHEDSFEDIDIYTDFDDYMESAGNPDSDIYPD